MRRIIKFVTGLGLVFLIGGNLTQPDKKAHVEALTNRMVSAMMNVDIDEMSAVSEDIMPGVRNKLEIIINSSLNVKNHVLFNVGEYDLGNGDQAVTVGILNHVFVLSNNAMTRMASELQNIMPSNIKINI